MFNVVKNKGNIVKAYKLGDNHPIINKLISEKKIKCLENGKYEVFSQEALNAGSGHGQIAYAGDYVKIDSSGAPYPNDNEYFITNHKHLEGDEYEQIPKELKAWDVNEPMCDEVQFLIDKKGLTLDKSNPEQYYTAPLWGTIESANIDGILMFYSITYGIDGKVEDAEFNLVNGEEFEKTYNRC